MKTLQEEYLETTQEFERAQKKWEKTRDPKDWKKVEDLMGERLRLRSKIVEERKGQ